MATPNRYSIHLEIITQERLVLSREVLQVTAPGIMGEVTILPKHIPLFTRLKDGIVSYKTADSQDDIAILGGFMDVAPGNKVTILADAAIQAQEVSLAQAEAAKRQAQETMKQKVTEVEFRQAEASLRRALLELKVAHRKKRQEIPNQP